MTKDKEDDFLGGAKGALDSKFVDGGSEYKLKGKLPAEFEEQMGGASEQWAKINTAFRKRVSDFMNANTDEFGVVNTSHEEFATGLTNNLYGSFGTAMDMDKSNVTALADIHKQGIKAPKETLAYRKLFDAWTGLDTERLEEQLGGMERVDFATVDKLVHEQVQDTSVKEATRLVTSWYAAKDDGKVADPVDSLKTMINIAGMRIPKKQMIVPEQREQVFQNVFYNLLQRHGSEFLPRSPE